MYRTVISYPNSIWYRITEWHSPTTIPLCASES